jgi:hypothetical protein
MDEIRDRQPFVLSYYCDESISGFLRSYFPFYILQMQGKIKFNHSASFIRDEEYYSQIDVVYVSCGFDVSYIRKLSSLKERCGFRLVYNVDRMIDDCQFELFDEVVVSTPFLIEHYLQVAESCEFAMIPTKISYSWAGHFYDEKKRVETYIAHSLRPRVLCLGRRDDVVLSDEFEWVFLEDDTMFNHIEDLKCQAVVALLDETLENHAMSDVWIQISGAHGLPIVCQDMTPFKRAAMRFKTGEQMRALLKKVLIDEETYLLEVRRARVSVEKDWLEIDENLNRYLENKSEAVKV